VQDLHQATTADHRESPPDELRLGHDAGAETPHGQFVRGGEREIDGLRPQRLEPPAGLDGRMRAPPKIGRLRHCCDSDVRQVRDRWADLSLAGVGGFAFFCSLTLNRAGHGSIAGLVCKPCNALASG